MNFAQKLTPPVALALATIFFTFSCSDSGGDESIPDPPVEEIIPNSSSSVEEFRCGLEDDYQAIIYDPATQFCYNYNDGYPSVEDKCNGNEFNPTTHFCYKNELLEKCNFAAYDPATQFCYNFSDGYTWVVDKCNGNEFNAETHGCYENKLLNQCQGYLYDPVTQFCNDYHASYTNIIDKCEGEEYNLTTHFCPYNKLLEKCAGLYVYDPATEFCYDGNIKLKCGGEEYNLATQICASGGVVLTQCGIGNNYYNPATQFCDGENIGNKCGGKEYDLYSQFCSNNNVVDKGEFTDERDGKKYKTVIIGTQVWMAENLNYEVDGSKCYYNDEDNCDTYGRLYDWATAMDGAATSTANPSGVQGVCPNGWHLPSDAEWDVLMASVGGDATAGTKLKAAEGWNSDGSGTDEFGFAALPGGYGYSDGYFGSVGSYGYWWSATEYDAYYAYFRGMLYFEYVDRIYFTKTILRSVRCVKD